MRVGFLEQADWGRIVRRRVLRKAFSAEGQALVDLSKERQGKKQTERFDRLCRVDIDSIRLPVI